MKLDQLLVVAGLVAVGAAQAQKVKVMLLGDSITEITCWRPLVWTQLATANLTGSIQLVGSMNGAGSCQKPAGFDGHHEGHSGIQANEVVKKIAGWVQTTKPDVVQFMLGTNDVNIGKKDDKSILEAYNSILASIRAANPKVFIVPFFRRLDKINKLIPTSWSDKTIEAVNTQIPAWVKQHDTAQSPITIADVSRAAGMTNAMLQGDKVHPNNLGDQFIAKQLGPVLIQVIKAKIEASV